MSPIAKKQKGSGSKKFDRNRKSAQNLRYRAERRHVKSHCRRIARHLARHTGDVAAVSALERYRAL